MNQSIFTAIDQKAPELTALRRDFHRYPETRWTEFRTSARIAEILTRLGYEVLMGQQVCKPECRMAAPEADVLEAARNRAMAQGADPVFLESMKGGFTGVIGILRRGEGPTVALRFDIDALPLTEATGHRSDREGYRSRNEGCMHGCGHDGHIAIGLGTAWALMQVREQLHGTVKLIFQPAEEGAQGARAVVDSGHLDGVEYVLGAHMMGGPETATGQIRIQSGKTLATSKFDAVFHGTPSHAGQAPEQGNNALLAAAAAIQGLYAIPRHGTAGTQINVGTIRGGSGRNVVCSEVRLEAEVRGETDAANGYMKQYAFRILRSAAAMHGCTVGITLAGEAVSVENTPALSEQLARVWESMGLPVQRRFDELWTASEDFSCMAQRVQQQGGQSCYFRVLSACTAGLHQAGFDFDESALPTGVKAFVSAALELMK